VLVSDLWFQFALKLSDPYVLSKNLVEGSVERNCLLNQFFCVLNRTGGVDSLSNPNGVGGVQGDCSVSLNWYTDYLY
jgi:hypothetical protein